MRFILLATISVFALISNVKVQKAVADDIVSVKDLYNFSDSISANLKRANYEEAVRRADKLINILAPIVTKPGEMFAALLVHARFRRYEALAMNLKFPDALIEVLKMREACERLQVCSALKTQAHVDWMQKEIRESIKRDIIETEIDKSRVKKAFQQLMLVLHPDKNAELNAESKKSLSALFIEIHDAFEKYKKGTRNV